MKKILLYLLAASSLFGAAGDIKIDIKNSSDNAWISTIFAKSNNGILGTNSSGVPGLLTGITWSSPTLSVPDAFVLSSAGSVDLTVAGSSEAINLNNTTGTGGYTNFRFNSTSTSAIGFSAAVRNFSRDSTASAYEGISYGNSVVFGGLRYGGTAAALTATPSQQTITKLTGYGYYTDGTPAVTGERGVMRIMSNEAFTSTAQGTYIAFGVTPNTTTTEVDVLYLGNSDGLGSQWSGVSALRITGGAGNMTVLAGTGASRIITFQTTTSGSTATTALTLGADQSATFTGTIIGASSQSLSGAGAVDVTHLNTFFTSSGVAQALTLANGTAGQVKHIVHQVDGGSGVLTPTSKIGYTTITFTNVGDSVTLVYTSNGWAIVGIFGAVAV